ncbi:MAG: hypothetical protein GC180_03640 [Bacteroidetes bacterium]|nr:hypothetical protein [Bacteroidota bacterium]
MKLKYLIILGLFAACSPSNNPFQETEPTTSDPHIRASELNDSAIDLFSKGNRFGEDALLVFDRAIVLDSTYDKPQINKIAVLMQLRRLEEAEKVALELSKIHSVDPNLLALSGMLYRMQGDTANALIYLDMAVNMFKDQLNNLDSIGPVYTSHKNSIGLLYWLMGNTKASEEFAPGMTSEEAPSDEMIAAQFWMSIQPDDLESADH